MKNTIRMLLLLLLLLLVGTCVYQKTYSIYADRYDKNTAKNASSQPTPLLNTSISTVQKKESSSEKPVQKILSTEKISEAEPSKETPLKEPVSEELSILKKIKASVLSAVSSNNEDEAVDAPQAEDSHAKNKEEQNIAPLTTSKAIDTELKEKEVVDYLLGVLKEQDTALLARDVAEDELHTLIKEALKNRKLAIENMQKASLDIETRHQQRIEKRNINSQNIYKYNMKEGK